MTDPIIVSRFAKNRTDEIVVALHEYGGELYVDVRSYVPAGGQTVPTKKGVRFNIALVGNLIDGLRAASAEAFRRGAVDEPNEE